jgi:hypothetical protein
MLILTEKRLIWRMMGRRYQLLGIAPSEENDGQAVALLPISAPSQK